MKFRISGRWICGGDIESLLSKEGPYALPSFCDMTEGLSRSNYCVELGGAICAWCRGIGIFYLCLVVSILALNTCGIEI